MVGSFAQIMMVLDVLATRCVIIMVIIIIIFVGIFARAVLMSESNMKSVGLVIFALAPAAESASIWDRSLDDMEEVFGKWIWR